MTQDSPFDDEIATTEDLDAAIGQLLSEAARSGIDPRGTFVYRDDDEPRDFEVVVVELDREESTD